MCSSAGSNTSSLPPRTDTAASRREPAMPDLSTTYLGLKLDCPLVPSASPLSRSLDNLRRLQDAGAGAVVLYSLFEEQINAESHELDHFLSRGTESNAEALSYFPEPVAYRLLP